MNSRLDTLQAAVLQVKLKAFADYELAAVNKVATKYTELLKDAVKTPVIPPGLPVQLSAVYPSPRQL